MVDILAKCFLGNIIAKNDEWGFRYFTFEIAVPGSCDFGRRLLRWKMRRRFRKCWVGRRQFCPGTSEEESSVVRLPPSVSPHVRSPGRHALAAHQAFTGESRAKRRNMSDIKPPDHSHASVDEQRQRAQTNPTVDVGEAPRCSAGHSWLVGLVTRTRRAAFNASFLVAGSPGVRSVRTLAQ